MSIEGKLKATSEFGEAGESLLGVLMVREKPPVSTEGQEKATSKY